MLSKLSKYYKRLVILAIVASLVYLLYRTIYINNENTILLVKNSENKVVDVKSSYICFVPFAAFNNVSVTYLQKYGMIEDNLIFYPQSLILLNDENYAIKIAFAINYGITNNLKIDYDRLSDSGQILKNYFNALFKDILNKSLINYLNNPYDYYKIKKNINGIIDESIQKVKSVSADNGIIINNIFIKSIYIPDYKIYYNGINYLNSILSKNKINALKKKDYELLEKQQSIKNDRYIEHLKKISRLIKENKDILRYIYIDKLSDNVKVIVTPEKEIPSSIIPDIDDEDKDYENFKK